MAGQIINLGKDGREDIYFEQLLQGDLEMR